MSNEFIRPQYTVHDIGIYIGEISEYEQVTNQIGRQLEGFEYDCDTKVVIERFIRFQKSDPKLKNECDEVVPQSSSFSYLTGVHYLIDLGFGYSISKDVLTVYVERDATVSMPFLIQQLLFMSNQCFVHGAGLAVDEVGKLVIAFGGIGKTALISSMNGDGRVQLFGDDLVIIDANGIMRSYHRPLCIYPYHKSLFPKYFEKNYCRIWNPTLLNRILNKIRTYTGLGKPLSFNYITVPAYRLFSRDQMEQAEVKIREIYLVKRSSILNDVRVNRLSDTSVAANYATNIIFHEFHEFLRVTFGRQAFLNKPPDHDIHRHYECCLSGFSHSKKILEIIIPEAYDAERTAFELRRILVGGPSE